MKPIIVLKIGTSTLTAGTENISRGKIEDISRQILELKDRYSIILVSSGAITTARQFIKLSDSKKQIEVKSALSAIGQPKLMQIYMEVFSDFGLQAAQCLLTHYDLKGADSRENTKATITDLLKHDYIPIINENDTVAVEEIILGDNDKLSAMVAELVRAEKLVIASDIDGIFTDNPNLNLAAKLIEEVESIQDIKAFAQDVENGLGTGGMQSKIHALEICEGTGIEVLIVNGGIQFFLRKALKKEIRFTRFKG
jgi:glutamate 5-kinase